jgi:DNA (cytosine-5)-methyltransferase 1
MVETDQGGLSMEKKICELFAGVGGFRLGFDALKSGWDTVWFSQWEPGKKIQWAHDCYVAHFGDSPDKKGELHTDEDIASVNKADIPNHTLLVGGFPCQDYSVAHTLSSAKGIEGKKGVLWWQIRDTLIAKEPPFCLLENVDRLLKSPAKQRGRDFGVILACFAQLGYSVEWRVVNAAEYGAGQRRRRTFIFAYRNDTKYGQAMKDTSPEEIIKKDGFMSRSFPIQEMSELKTTNLPEDIVTVSDSFAFAFQPAGYMTDNHIYTATVTVSDESPILLGELLEKCKDEEYYLTSDRLQKWNYLKGAKKITRTSANGHEYVFSEGPIAFPDPWDRPARTMLTSESTLNRSSHVVADPGTGRLRILLPEEAEKIQGFPVGWTGCITSNGKAMPRRMRYFCMGNALVVPMITRMGKTLDSIIQKE